MQAAPQPESECGRPLYSASVEERLLMLRRITSTLLFLLLTSGGSASATASCARSSTQTGQPSSPTQCKMARITPRTNCCWHTSVHDHGKISESLGCCQMSAPFQQRPDGALPSSTSSQFKLQASSLALASSPLTSPLALPRFWSVWATIAFCPDRSETYLLASTFRI